jgi:hypothetical protein
MTARTPDYSDLMSKDHMFRYFLPYCYRKIEGVKGHVYIPLNRNYLPLGVIGMKDVGPEGFDDTYSGFKSHWITFKKDPLEFQDVWAEQPLYLYRNKDDHPTYFARLERLMLQPQQAYLVATRPTRDGYYTGPVVLANYPIKGVDPTRIPG